MSTRWVPIVLAALAAPALAHTQSFAVAMTADADAACTEPAGYLMKLPGIGDDFVLFQDGQVVQRTNGTARLSAFVHRSVAFDRDFYLVLEFSGRLAPGSPGYPPAGSPTLTLQPSAYVPTGTIDPGTYVYYTQVTGTLTGIRAYDGARLTLTQLGAAQLGLGAANKNVLNGLAANFTVNVVQQPAGGALVPTGPAQLRATLLPSEPYCATHVETDPAVSAAPPRNCLTIPGLGSDYLFVPVGDWTESPTGTATLNGIVRRQSDYTDSWSLGLSFGGRVDPGSPSHPPAGSPLLELLPAAYAAQGGPVDPAAWRYYTTVTGSLVGSGINAGGSIQLTPQSAAQVGLGAGQGCLFVGLTSHLTASSVVQPTGRTISVTGPLLLRTSVAVNCLIPVPQVTGGVVQSATTITQQKVIYTGIDLGWTELAAVGPRLLDTNTRKWVDGNVRVIDHNTVEVSIPQGMAPGSYPARLFTIGGISNALTLNLTAPTSITLRTENDRLIGEDQHWLIHQGTLPTLAYSFLLLSLSNVPTSAPGIVMLDIGDNGAALILFTGALHDAATGVASITLPGLDPSMLGLRVYAQGALWDVFAPSAFPLSSSDVWFTDYL